MAKVGRPPTYTDEQRDEIIAHILMGIAAGRAVTTILIEDEGLCSDSQFWRWYYADEELRGKVAQAREHGVEARLERAIHVASTPQMGIIETEKHIMGEDGPYPVTEVKREDMLGHRKLLVDTLIKSAQMLKPKTYGPKLDLTSGGEKLGIVERLEAARRRVAERHSGGEE